jgi:hypothetical protein
MISQQTLVWGIGISFFCLLYYYFLRYQKFGFNFHSNMDPITIILSAVGFPLGIEIIYKVCSKPSDVCIKEYGFFLFVSAMVIIFNSFQQIGSTFRKAGLES